MSIQALLDRVEWKCSWCGVPINTGCDCVAKNSVVLKCPDCGRSQDSWREPGDGPVVVASCPACVDAVPA